MRKWVLAGVVVACAGADPGWAQPAQAPVPLQRPLPPPFPIRPDSTSPPEPVEEVFKSGSWNIIYKVSGIDGKTTFSAATYSGRHELAFYCDDNSPTSLLILGGNPRTMPRAGRFRMTYRADNGRVSSVVPTSLGDGRVGIIGREAIRLLGELTDSRRLFMRLENLELEFSVDGLREVADMSSVCRGSRTPVRGRRT